MAVTRLVLDSFRSSVLTFGFSRSLETHPRAVNQSVCVDLPGGLNDGFHRHDEFVFDQVCKHIAIQAKSRRSVERAATGTSDGIDSSLF